ncbi:hypothetical protein SeLEV6574_g03329 [Synchytrium endobioticum]|nr:hypothetical protein SeLEV6574_g03331 [Synchytrium endobioticum]TPX46247.1 hypothetical protein SeLEV6574_g03329 [Synchytrium endobioticum]
MHRGRYWSFPAVSLTLKSAGPAHNVIQTSCALLLGLLHSWTSTTEAVNEVQLVGGWGGNCWGGPQNLVTIMNFNALVDGNNINAEGGLPVLTICGSLQGAPVDLDCASPGNANRLPDVKGPGGGICPVWETLDDQPNVWCAVHITPPAGANGTIDCTQIALTATSAINGTNVNTVIVPKNGKAAVLNNNPAQAAATTTSPAPAGTQAAVPSPIPATLGDVNGNGTATVGDPNSNGTVGSSMPVTVTLPLQQPDRCNPAGPDKTQSTKRLGFKSVRIGSPASKEPHQPMDDAPEGLVAMLCQFSVPMIEVKAEGALDQAVVENGGLKYSMKDDAPDQVWFGTFGTPCDTQTGKEATEIKITSCTCTSKAGPCTATITILTVSSDKLRCWACATDSCPPIMAPISFSVSTQIVSMELISLR